jgi:predicted transposase YbfD/YdcC
MDQVQYSTLLETLQSMPDMRKARGKRYSWTLLMAMICSALVSGQCSGHAIAHWISVHAKSLHTALKIQRSSMPSESTIRRALRALDIETLEHRVSGYTQGLASSASAASDRTAEGESLQGQAIDGKELRGVRAHGHPLCLVSLVTHQSGIVLAQTAVDGKSNEITAVPQLLAGRDLKGVVITMDALLTQQHLAQQIIDQGGHYLMVVKANQARLHAAIQLLFDLPPWTRQERDQEYWTCNTFDKGHGRLEWRTLECSTALGDYLAWPGMKQVLRRTCKRVIQKTGEIQQEVTYAVSDLSHSQASAAQLEKYWRGHWTIENRLHYVRDVTMGEDACQIHRGGLPQVLATLRNAIISLLRVKGWSNIADAIRYFSASVYRSLKLIGALST